MRCSEGCPECRRYPAAPAFPHVIQGQARALAILPSLRRLGLLCTCCQDERCLEEVDVHHQHGIEEVGSEEVRCLEEVAPQDQDQEVQQEEGSCAAV